MKQRILELVEEAHRISENGSTHHERAIADTARVFLSAAADSCDRKFTPAELMTPGHIRSVLEIRRLLDAALCFISGEMIKPPKPKKAEIHFGVN